MLVEKDAITAAEANQLASVLKIDILINEVVELQEKISSLEKWIDEKNLVLLKVLVISTTVPWIASREREDHST